MCSTKEDRRQYVADIDRYALYRRHGVAYVQVTSEKLRHPRAMVREVHQAIVAGGYDGPPADFGEQWDQLFMRVSSIIRSTCRISRRAVS